jgi:hypothetical protein
MRSGDRQAVYVVGGGLLVVGSLATMVVAGFSSDPALHYTAIAAVVAFLALLAAAAAVVLTWPQYDAWRREQLRRPNIRVWLEVADDTTQVARRVDASAVLVPRSFVLRVAIANDGDAPMREALINFVVPATCHIVPIDPPAKVHYPSPLPSRSAELVPGEVHDVRFTVARADITPGHHVFHSRISLVDGDGPWPVMIEVSGDPSPPDEVRSTRLQLHVVPDAF